MRMLLTGGAGFVGSHLVGALIRRGHDVLVLDDLSTGRVENLAAYGGRAVVQVGSILDGELVDRLAATCDRVFHLAATVGVERVATRPEETRAVIETGTKIVLDAAIGREIPALVVSSSEVYGFDPPLPVREADVLSGIDGDAPRLSYVHAKIAADAYARSLFHAGHPVLAIRPFNVIGPRQREDGGAVLPRFVAQALAGAPLLVHGDGRQRRTFLDVRDLAEVLAEVATLDAFPRDAVNVGGTAECSIRELAERVVAVTGSRSGVTHVDPPALRGGVEVRRRVPDLERIKEWVSFAPARSIDDAILGLAEELSPHAAV